MRHDGTKIIIKNSASLVLTAGIWVALCFVPGVRLRALQEPASRLAAAYLNVPAIHQTGSVLICSAPAVRVTSACSGAAFLTLAYLLILTRTRFITSWWRQPLALTTAYVATLLTNSLRLSATPWVKTVSEACISPPFHEAIHLLSGLFTYLSAFVILAFLFNRRCFHDPSQVPPAA